MKRIARLTLTLGLLGWLWSCRAPATLEPPADPGRHAVGVTTLELRDTRRDRPVTVELWYPARAALGADPARYDLRLGGVRLGGLASPTGAVRNAHRARGGAYPLVVMSHGFASTRYAHISLAEYLASHGYVVAAPDHHGNTMFDLIGGIDEDTRARSTIDRPRDISFVIDALLASNTRRHPILRGLVDPDRIGVAGHSLGGYTALAVSGATFEIARLRRECPLGSLERHCSALLHLPGDRDRVSLRDRRVRAAFLISPAGMLRFGADGLERVAVPTLVVGGRRDITTPYADYQAPTFAALKGPRYLLDLPDAGHLSGTDVCPLVDAISSGLAGWFGGPRARDGCGDDFMPLADAHAEVHHRARALFDLYLKGHAGAAAALADLTGAPTAPVATSTASTDAATARRFAVDPHPTSHEADPVARLP